MNANAAPRRIAPYLLLAAILVTAALIFVAPLFNPRMTPNQYALMLAATAAFGIILIVAYLIVTAVEAGTKASTAVALVALVVAITAVIAVSPLPDLISGLFYGGLEKLFG